MDLQKVAQARMHNLGLARPQAKAPDEMVRSMLAMQSQDYGPAKWSIGQRLVRATDADLDRAYMEGRILRTHVLRPTWHFVHPDDIGWLLALTGPRVLARTSSRYHQLGLDPDLLKRARKILVRALRGANHLTRKELREVLAKSRIETDTSRLSWTLMFAELNGVICSGGLRGKQHTYALMEERAPHATELDGDAALVELLVRYFQSHGPASAKDLRWWSSLTLQEIRRGLDLAGDKIECEVVEGIPMYFTEAPRLVKKRSPQVHLLQAYDEYIVGYTETRRALDATGVNRDRWSWGDAFPGAVVLDTQIAGRWKRRVVKDTLRNEVSLYKKWNGTQMKALQKEAGRVARFFDANRTDLEVELMRRTRASAKRSP